MRAKRELLPNKPLFPSNLRFYKREGDAITGYAATQNADGLDEASAVYTVGFGRGTKSRVDDKEKRIKQTVYFFSTALADTAETELQEKGFKKE